MKQPEPKTIENVIESILLSEDDDLDTTALDEPTTPSTTNDVPSEPPKKLDP